MRTAAQKAAEWSLNSPNKISEKYVIAALDEYSMEMSVAFADWITDNCFNPFKLNGIRTWVSANYTNRRFTTKELYTLFLQKTFH